MSFDLGKAAFGAAVKQERQDRVRYIPAEQLRDNEKNFYEKSELEALADSIRTVGLLEPIRVIRDGDGWRIVSGHRRAAAWALLRQEDPERWAAIPAMALEGLDDLTETFALITANSTARVLTYGEKCRQEQALRDTLAAMAAAGMEVPKNLGAYMAEQLGTNRNEVSRMHSVNENLIPEAREQLDRGEMTAQAAYEMSRKPEAEQKAAVSNLDTEKPKREPDAIDALKTIRKTASLRKGAEHLLNDLIERVSALQNIQSRSDGIAELKAGLKRRGSFGDRTAWVTAQDVTLAVTAGDGMQYCTPSELWDQMCLAALRKVSNLDTEKPEPAAPAWRTDRPEKDGEYVCFYKTPSGEKSVGLIDWKGKWMKYGRPVGDIYRVEQWTEVPHV